MTILMTLKKIVWGGSYKSTLVLLYSHYPIDVDLPVRLSMLQKLFHVHVYTLITREVWT